ncbi:hypothetical protein LOTGIDRAFT_169964 [Lottia gigantea]|uniref:RING-type domain-containing protein n=1 Tax=Lottia gigantea TaxID=225164 RepID=V3ZJE6_LOTGI|nr:hypothetical protein LOTGIDRAFT_169964 [Lottia gigantea]ESO82490.1 hypothetical protein LOTGIDRAFT_169964 [Lottia gigantea]
MPRAHGNAYMGKLLAKLDEKDKRDDPNGNDEECVICMGAKATMQTFPCSHKVVCRKCFIKTIQVAVSQRSLPLRCVICRARILKLRQAALPKVAVTTPTNAVARTMPKSPSLFQCVK